MDIRDILKKSWDFIWNSNSVWSWLLNIVLAYFFIVYIFYPGVGALFKTPFPLVAVVSGSMEHMIINHDSGEPFLCDQTFDRTHLIVSFDQYWEICGEWYENNGITKEQFNDFSFRRGFNKGDIMFIYGTSPKDLEIGDVIVFRTDYQWDARYSLEPIIHRIVDIKIINEQYYFTTKGDHNEAIGPIDMNINENNVLGKAVFRIPFLGWIKVWFTDLINWSVLMINRI
ncbi:MAG: signal peptidase I [Candidatus Woesearchaeota archaeon]